jgi:uncharacterized paraquat-inducible protein A
MALAIVCSNCGWRKRIKRRSEVENRYCPRCTSVTHVVDQEPPSLTYLWLAIGGLVLAVLLLGCPFACIVGLALRRF